MTALIRYKIPLLLLLIIFFTKSYSQTYKYKVKWDLKRSMGSSELFFYLNTGDSYPYNGTYANAATNSSGNFVYILNNADASPLDGVVVSNTPLRLTQAVKEPSGSFTQRSGVYVTAPESGYWQNTFGSPLGGNMVTNNSPFEFYYLYTLVQLNNYDASKTDLQVCKPFSFSASMVGEGGNITCAVEYFHSTSGGWKELLPYQRRYGDAISIQFSQIPNLQLDQNFQLRVRYSRTGAKAADYSDILTYKFIPCPPAILGEPVKDKPSCYNGNDGKATFTFDRDIASNEYFLVNLVKVENGHNINLPDKKIVQADFTDRKITFESLPAGSYFLHYQTFLNNGSTPTADKFSDPFPIENPDPLSFSILETQPNCPGEIGKIQIKATGGKSPYYYTIDSESEIEFVSITNIIDISGGTHNIKVRDTNNCVDLQANDTI